MKTKLFAATFAAAVAASSMAFADASTFNATYFAVPVSDASGDFGVCCSSPSATLPKIAIGALLGPDGLPVGTGTDVKSLNSAGEITWWSGTPTGTGTITLPYSGSMFAPNSTGSNNTNFYETAILSGVYTGAGSAISLSLSSDDDTLVYVDGKYVGGLPGVHGTIGTKISLDNSIGTHSIEVFYADRAHVDATLGLNVDGATISATPEPATWALMMVGVGGMGAALRTRRRKAVAAA